MGFFSLLLIFLILSCFVSTGCWLWERNIVVFAVDTHWCPMSLLGWEYMEQGELRMTRIVGAEVAWRYVKPLLVQ